MNRILFFSLIFVLSCNNSFALEDDSQFYGNFFGAHAEPDTGKSGYSNEAEVDNKCMSRRDANWIYSNIRMQIWSEELNPRREFSDYVGGIDENNFVLPKKEGVTYPIRYSDHNSMYEKVGKSVTLDLDPKDPSKKVTGHFICRYELLNYRTLGDVFLDERRTLEKPRIDILDETSGNKVVPTLKFSTVIDERSAEYSCHLQKADGSQFSLDKDKYQDFFPIEMLTAFSDAGILEKPICIKKLKSMELRNDGQGDSGITTI